MSFPQTFPLAGFNEAGGYTVRHGETHVARNWRSPQANRQQTPETLRHITHKKLNSANNQVILEADLLQLGLEIRPQLQLIP